MLPFPPKSSFPTDMNTMENPQGFMPFINSFMALEIVDSERDSLLTLLREEGESRWNILYRDELMRAHLTVEEVFQEALKVAGGKAYDISTYCRFPVPAGFRSGSLEDLASRTALISPSFLYSAHLRLLVYNVFRLEAGSYDLGLRAHEDLRTFKEMVEDPKVMEAIVYSEQLLHFLGGTSESPVLQVTAQELEILPE